MLSPWLSLFAAMLFPTVPAPQQPVTPTIKVDTKLTVVDVTVTDKYGHPVHGLKASDFTIKEDGKPQSIRNFDEYGGSRVAIPMGPRLPDGVYTNIPVGPPAAGTVHILLFNQLDRLEDLIYSRDQAVEYLKTMPTGTRVAILSMEDGVRVVQNITTDRDLLIATVRSLNYHPVGGVTTNSGAPCVWPNLQNKAIVKDLREIAMSFAAIHGKKNLIWFTHGAPWLTNAAYLKSLGYECITDYSEQLHAAYNMLVGAQISISTVDPRGLEGLSLEGGISRNSVAGDFIGRQINQESIRDFAEATGGKAYYNRNDLDAAVREAVDAGSDYYALAYTPPLQGYDGKYHAISINLNRADLQLVYRKGYTSVDVAILNGADGGKKSVVSAKKGEPFDAAANVPTAVAQFRASMAHGMAPSNQFLLAASITPEPGATAVLAPVKDALNSKPKSKTLIRYDVVCAFPPGQVTFSEDVEGLRKGSIEFEAAAYAEDGKLLTVTGVTADVTLKPEQVADFQQRSFKFPMQMDLPPGKIFVRVGALDVLSGKSGTIEVPQTVAKPKAEQH